MVEPQLVDYIKKARLAKQTDEQSRSLLVKNGWTDEEINEAISAAGSSLVQPQQQIKPEIEPDRIKAQARPQLVDYINKARRDGAPDEQSRSFLVKNGWTDDELNDAFASAEPMQPKTEPQVSGQAQINRQPEPASQPKTQYQPQPQQPQQAQPRYEARPAQKGGIVRLILKLFIVLILLVIIGAGVYFAIVQKDSLINLFNKILSYPTKMFSTTVPPAPVVGNETNDQKSTPTPPISLMTQKIATILPEYDISKITVAAFSKAGDKVAYCAPQKIGGLVSCFLNDVKLFDNPYSYKPYWIGISPNGGRVAFLYFDAVKKQSFVFENGVEGTRYNGTITYPKFSDNSTSFMFMVMGNDNKNFVVLDGVAKIPHDKIYTVPEFSLDGDYLLYGARDGQDLFWVADKVNEGQ